MQQSVSFLTEIIRDDVSNNIGGKDATKSDRVTVPVVKSSAHSSKELPNISH